MTIFATAAAPVPGPAISTGPSPGKFHPPRKRRKRISEADKLFNKRRHLFNKFTKLRDKHPLIRSLSRTVSAGLASLLFLIDYCYLLKVLGNEHFSTHNCIWKVFLSTWRNGNGFYFHSRTCLFGKTFFFCFVPFGLASAPYVLCKLL